MNPELLGWCLILCQNSESQTCWEPPNSGWRKRWLTRQTAAMLSLLYSQSSFTGPPIPRVILLSHCTGHKRLRQLLKKIIFDNPMPMMITSTTWTDRLSKSSTCYIYKIHTLHQSASLLTCNYPVWPSSCIWPCIIKILLIIFLIYLICSNFLLWVHSSSTEQLHHYNYQKAELKKKKAKLSTFTYSAKIKWKFVSTHYGMVKNLSLLSELFLTPFNSTSPSPPWKYNLNV